MALENIKQDKKDLIKEILKTDCIMEKELFVGETITFMKANIKMDKETDMVNLEKVKTNMKDFGLMANPKTIPNFKRVSMNLKLIHKK